MNYRVVFTDPHQHTFPDELLRCLAETGAKFEARLCSDEEETMAFCRDADAVMTSCSQITSRVIEAMARCRIISRVGTGYDNIDVQAASQREIPVTNVPNFCTEEVANHTLALLLACDRTIAIRDRELRRGEWNVSVLVKTGRRLAGRVLGLVGYGAIGQAVAQRAAAFGLQIRYYDPYQASPPGSPPATRCESLEGLLSEADFVSLHVALTSATHHLIGSGELRQMKPGAILINTARGPVVNESDLIEALRNGVIFGAGLDVYDVEPLAADSPLIQLDNVVLSPHTAAHSVDAMAEVRRRAVGEVKRALRGDSLLHVVNRDALENAASEA